MGMDKDCEKAEGSISLLLKDIFSALKESDAIISNSYDRFHDVIKNVPDTEAPNEEKRLEKESYLAESLYKIKEEIVRINNCYIDFNSKCDL